MIYSCNVTRIKGKSIISATSALYDRWFSHTYGQPFSPDAALTMFDLSPIVIPWDHQHTEQKIFGDIWHIPGGTSADVFRYLKMWSFPPSFFVSNNPQNDAKQYVEEQASIHDETRYEALLSAIAHERIHNLVTNVVSGLCLPAIVHWWGEGVAITYADINHYQKLSSDEYEKEKGFPVEEIIHSPRLDYIGSLSCWLAFSALEVGSFDPQAIYPASDRLIGKMVEFAKTGKKIQPSEIPQILFPSVPQNTLFREAQNAKSQVLDLLSQGQFH